MMTEDDDSDKRLRRNTWRTDLCRNTASPVGTLVQSPPCCRYAVTPPRSFDDPSPRLAPCPSNVAAHPDMNPCQGTRLPHLALPHMRLKDCGPSCPCSYGLGPLCPLRERLAEILAESNWKAQQIFQFHSDVRDSLHIFRLQCGGAQYALGWYMPRC